MFDTRPLTCQNEPAGVQNSLRLPLTNLPKISSMVDNPQNPDIRETQPLKGKNVLITGTSRGIGTRTAIAFATAGADLVELVSKLLTG